MYFGDIFCLKLSLKVVLTWAQIAIGILYSGIAHERQPNFWHRKKNRNGGILSLRLAYGRRSNNTVPELSDQSNSRKSSKYIPWLRSESSYPKNKLKLHYMWVLVIPCLSSLQCRRRISKSKNNTIQRI